MTISTGLRNELLTAFVARFDHCAGLLFSGTPPASPDLAVPAGSILIAKLAGDPDAWIADGSAANGVTWSAPSNGIVTATPGSTLQAKGVAAGTATWGWFVPDEAAADSLLASAVIPRLQFTVGVGTGNLKLSNATFSVGSLASADPSLMTVGFKNS